MTRPPKSPPPLEPSIPAQAGQATPELIDITLIVPNRYQPRRQADSQAIAELALSIERDGLLQPPTLRRIQAGAEALSGRPIPEKVQSQAFYYELAFGHNRLEAFKLLASQGTCACSPGAGKTDYRHMPAFVRELTDLQMFEQAIAENIQRRDLNPVEQAAAMQRYMTDFGKSSQEAGEFFNVNDATVRGTVRLLDLPETAQAQLANGDMTVGTARKLLTIQRIAGDKVTEKTVEKLAVPSVDTEHIVNQQLKSGADTVEMWSFWRSDESPRAGNGLWLLGTPAEKLPNELLPELMVGDALKALGMENDAGHRNDISQVLVELKYDAAKGTQTAIQAGHPLDLVDRLAHLIDPPACTACPFYAKVDKGHYCAFKACHERKIVAFSKAQLASLVKKLDIPAYASATDGKETFTLKNDWNNKEKFKKIFDARTDVRLQMVYTSAQKSYGSKHDYTDSWLVRAIVVGKTAHKLVEKRRKDNAERNVPYDSKANEWRWKIEAQNRDAAQKVIDLATPIFSPAFAHIGDEPMRALLDNEPKVSSEKLRILLVKKAFNNLVKWQMQEAGPIAVAKHLVGVAKTWGITLPENWMDLAQGLTEGLLEYTGLDGQKVITDQEQSETSGKRGQAEAA